MALQKGRRCTVWNEKAVAFSLLIILMIKRADGEKDGAEEQMSIDPMDAELIEFLQVLVSVQVILHYILKFATIQGFDAVRNRS